MLFVKIFDCLVTVRRDQPQLTRGTTSNSKPFSLSSYHEPGSDDTGTTSNRCFRRRLWPDSGSQCDLRWTALFTKSSKC